jgi:hypothetical protein
MKKILILINLLWWISTFSYAQCDKTLVEKAALKAGKNTVLVRDFKVKLKEGSRREPVPSSRFTVLMQKDIMYRFTMVDAIENKGKSIMQLFDKSTLVKNSLDTESHQDSGSIQYVCSHTGDYQLIVTFVDGRAGCAAGIMTMLVDSVFLASHQSPTEPAPDFLYLDMENPLLITTDSVTTDKLIVTIDNGEIVQHDGQYFARVSHEGIANIFVKRVNASDKVVEEMSQNFKATLLAEPKVFLEGTKDNILNIYQISTVNKLEVLPSAYHVVEFYLSENYAPYSGIRCYDENLTFENRDFLKNLKLNDRFYINNIKLEKPDGSIIMVNSIEYRVR